MLSWIRSKCPLKSSNTDTTKSFSEQVKIFSLVFSIFHTFMEGILGLMEEIRDDKINELVAQLQGAIRAYFARRNVLTSFDFNRLCRWIVIFKWEIFLLCAWIRSKRSRGLKFVLTQQLFVPVEKFVFTELHKNCTGMECGGLDSWEITDQILSSSQIYLQWR